MVVGIGNSGGDIAVEISRSAEKVRQKNRKASLLLGQNSRDLREMTKMCAFSRSIDSHKCNFLLPHLGCSSQHTSQESTLWSNLF